MIIFKPLVLVLMLVAMNIYTQRQSYRIVSFYGLVSGAIRNNTQTALSSTNDS